MSDQPPRGATVIKSKQGGGMKWLAGAAVAAVLLGGGYYAWSHYTPAPSDTTQVAQEDTTSPSAYNSGPTTPAAPEDNVTTGPDESASAASSSSAAATPAGVHHRTAPTQTAAVPEEVIGVMPASATSNDASVDAGEIVIHGAPRPVWTRMPSNYRLASYYPEHALERGSEGEASIHCTVLDGGALNCVQVSETPLHAGFGNAALRMSHALRHAPQRADGAPAAGTPVNLRVVFRMADDHRRG
ncbi:MAG: TonB family protein [Pseudomonadota bacterium]